MNYRIISELGSQKIRKFSKVFHVQRTSDSMEFILKIVEKNQETNLQQQKIIQESNFHFDNTFFQKNLDFWEDDEKMYLLKEYLPAMTLPEWWNLKDAKSKLEKLRVFINGIKPIFDFLSLQQIAHNDIKPSNFLVQQKDSDSQFYLIDFGLAFYYPSSDDDEVLFALGYSSPELVLSKKSVVNHASDIFSLGILLYHLWTQKIPLSHPNPTIFTNLQITHPIQNNDSIPKQIFEIISRMCVKHSFRLPPNQLSDSEVIQDLIKARNERYQSVDQVINDLDNVKLSNPWRIFNRNLF
jgi:serine/threonine-protein kinase